MNRTHIEKAAAIGALAFANGLYCSPSEDPAMSAFLETLDPLEQIDAWGSYQSGWLQASFSAPDPEEPEGKELDKSYHDGSDWRTDWQGYPRGEYLVPETERS
ncbi:MAG: hypothetical protein GWN58_13605 [Anaerolineae bacterium]|nr:hypothetical protein [Anaerolineae bacterium]